MTDNAIAPSRGQLATVSEPLSIEKVLEGKRAIEQLLKRVLKEKTHFDVIPGCGTKPTLLQPGAQAIALMFQLSPKVGTEEIIEHGDKHREYRYRVIVVSRVTGEVVSEGVGVCSTLESKYRYRWDPTGKQVPREYWNTRDPELLGGAEFVARKQKGGWSIFRRADHDNPADYYNTVAKMAFKRGFVHAVINATGASDIFTQDVEEAPVPDDGDDFIPDPPEAPRQPPQPRPGGGEMIISEPQLKRLHTIGTRSGVPAQTIKDYIATLGYSSSKDIRLKDYDRIIAWIEAGGTSGPQDEPGANG